MSQATPLVFSGHNSAALVLRRALMPPWIYLRGLMLFAFTGKPPAYILGHSYPHGVWFFFPLMFLLKSPLAFLLLLVLALVVGMVARFRPERLHLYQKEWSCIGGRFGFFCWFSRAHASSVQSSSPYDTFRSRLALLILLLAPCRER